MTTISKRMPTFGLIGYPLSHSFSRPYFTDKFERLGLSESHRYLNFELADIADFPAVLAEHPDLLGLNVTIPHKQSVMAYLDTLSPEAKAIGAVNTIHIQDGKTRGYNTDALGFEADLLDLLGEAAPLGPEKLSKNTAQKGEHGSRIYASLGMGMGDSQSDMTSPVETSSGIPNPSALQALVLGTGGAALAVNYVLQRLGIEARLVSRRPQAGQLSYEEVTAAVLAAHRLVINTTPLGMYPHLEDSPALPYEAFTARHFCYDLIYNPEQTKFLRRAAAQGVATRNGLGMLHAQAEAAWAIWQPNKATKE